MKLKSYLKEQIDDAGIVGVFMQFLSLACVVAVVCVVIYILYDLTVNEPIRLKQMQENNYQQMESIGINQRCDVLIAKSINSSVGFEGSFLLFSGSITSNVQENLRIGFNAKNGKSYILSIPIRKIEFIQSEFEKPTAELKMQQWNLGNDLQGNIDAYLQILEINLTPEQYAQLLS